MKCNYLMFIMLLVTTTVVLGGCNKEEAPTPADSTTMKASENADVPKDTNPPKGDAGGSRR